MKRVLTALVFVGLIVSARAASANIIVNPGFETGDFTGWTQFGNTTFNGVDGNPHSGTNAAFFGPIGTTGGILQNLPTAAGQGYDLSLWLDSDGGTPNEFDVFWNGGLIFAALNLSDTPYQLYAFSNLLATGASTELRLAFRDDPGFLFLDDVNVVETPEPASMLLLGTGLVYAGARRWRKARA
jgi:hypothetical protein